MDESNVKDVDYLGKYLVFYNTIEKQTLEQQLKTEFVCFDKNTTTDYLYAVLQDKKYYYKELVNSFPILEATEIDIEKIEDHIEAEVFSALCALLQLYKKKGVKEMVIHVPFVRITPEGYPFISIFCTTQIYDTSYFLLLENPGENLVSINKLAEVDLLLYDVRFAYHKGYFGTYQEVTNSGDKHKRLGVDYIVNNITKNCFGVDYEKIIFNEIYTLFDCADESTIHIQKAWNPIGESTGYTLFIGGETLEISDYIEVIIKSLTLFYNTITKGSRKRGMELKDTKYLKAERKTFKQKMMSPFKYVKFSYDLKSDNTISHSVELGLRDEE